MRKQMLDVLDSIASGDATWWESLERFIESLKIIIKESGYNLEIKPYHILNSGKNVIVKNIRLFEKGKNKDDHIAYFVYLFSDDGKRCYLSLNTKDLSPVSDRTLDEETIQISLQSNRPIKNNATADFENANLFSFEYQRESIPDEETLGFHLGEVIKKYDQLTPLKEDYLKNDFQKWMKEQKKANGKNYAVGTISSYTTLASLNFNSS